MTALADLLELTRLNCDRCEAALQGPVDRLAAIRRENAALSALAAQRFSDPAGSATGLEDNWRAWCRNRTLTLRREEALARAELEERRADMAAALAQADVIREAWEADRAEQARLREVAAGDQMDLMNALRGF